MGGSLFFLITGGGFVIGWVAEILKAFFFSSLDKMTFQIVGLFNLTCMSFKIL